MGADRSVHVLAESPIDPVGVSLALQKVLEKKKTDLVMMGKQVHIIIRSFTTFPPSASSSHPTEHLHTFLHFSSSHVQSSSEPHP